MVCDEEFVCGEREGNCKHHHIKNENDANQQISPKLEIYNWPGMAMAYQGCLISLWCHMRLLKDGNQEI